MCIPVYKSESYEYFRWVFVEVYVMSGYIFSYEILQEDYLHGKFITEFYFFFYSQTCSRGWINFYLQKQFSPSFNKTEKLQVFALYFRLEYAYYKNPPKECRQDINYAII